MINLKIGENMKTDMSKLTEEQAEQRIIGCFEECKFWFGMTKDLADHEDGRVRLLVKEMQLRKKMIGYEIKKLGIKK